MQEPAHLAFLISLFPQKKATIGIIGGTGSGKSTLVDLIARFYDATSGVITLDGQNVQTYSRQELREKIGVVPQKAALFQGTIRDNLSWGREDATDEEMWEALTTAQAREIVEKKDGQLDFRLEQNGPESFRWPASETYHCPRPCEKTRDPDPG